MGCEETFPQEDTQDSSPCLIPVVAHAQPRRAFPHAGIIVVNVCCALLTRMLIRVVHAAMLNQEYPHYQSACCSVSSSELSPATIVALLLLQYFDMLSDGIGCRTLERGWGRVGLWHKPAALAAD